MLGCLKRKAFLAAGMFFLQILRVLSLIGLGSVMASCWVLAIKVNMDKTYFVFDAASLVFLSGIALFLALSELPFGNGFFERRWPVFSDEHGGLGWLGLALIMIGCNILGKLNSANTEPDKIGMPWWRLVLASGILNLTFGVLNVLSTFVFYNGKHGINARTVRQRGVNAEDSSKLPSHYGPNSASSSINNEKASSFSISGLLRRFKKGDEGGKEQPRFHISMPISAHKDIERDAPYPPDDEKPQVSPLTGVQRPPSAHHPYNSRHRASSHYSAAHMSRF